MRIIIFKILVIFFLIHDIFAQSPQFKFEHISSGQNLSHNTVTGIIRDKEGFLWFTTIDGLNKFDGYTCRVYKHNENDSISSVGISKSLSVSFLHQVYEDTKGYIWITTRGGGVNRFDKVSETFKHFRHNPRNANSLINDNVNSILEDEPGKYWIGTETGLDLLNTKTGVIQHFKHEPADVNSLSSNWINRIMRDSDGEIWFSSFNGLNRYDPEKKIFKRYFKERSANSLSENFTTALYQDKDGIIWIGTKGGGLNSYDKRKNLFTRYSNHILKFLPSLPLNINSIIEYDSNHLLIGTDPDGLILFNKEKIFFYQYKHLPENSSSISSNFITEVFKDKQNIFWIGTWGGGVNKLYLAGKEFSLYRQSQANAGLQNYASVFALLNENHLEDSSKEDIIWIGTGASALAKLNRSTGKYTLLSFRNSRNQIITKGISSIFDDNKGSLWIASEGLIRLDKKTGSYKIFSYDPLNKSVPETITSNDIKCITADKKGNIWIGTEDRGAFKFDPEKKTWEKLFNNENNPVLVRFIYEDKSGTFWFGSYRHGLIKYDVNTGDTTVYSHNAANPLSISHNDVRQIIESENGEMWIATYGGGINRFDRNSEKFFHVKEADGLSNNFTYAILEDEEENFWISTNYGLTKYNRKNNFFKIYTQDDGLQNNEFNTGAYFKSKKGEMFFGGVNGFNCFYPNKILDNNHIPPVYITSFKIFDKEVVFDTAVTFKKQIELSYSDKFFSFDFTALDFINPSQNKYAYMLEGFDDQWISTDQRRFGSYTNLNPGEYTLRVIASNNDGVWNTAGASLKIIVAPPFWMTLWFRSLSVIFILAVLTGTVRYYSTRKLKKQIRILEKEQAIRKERERISRDLHDNVGSQLTFLISSIDNLTFNRDNPRLLDRLKDVSGYGRKTIKELRNTIWAMNHENTDITELILKLNEFKQEINSGIGNLHLDICNNINGSVLLSAVQILSLYRIIQEAVQNVIKHSCAARVEIIFNETEDNISLQISDNGKGFDPTGVSTGNGLTNMLSRCREAGGEFFITSSDKGTVINCIIKK